MYYYYEQPHEILASNLTCLALIFRHTGLIHFTHSGSDNRLEEEENEEEEVVTL
jgi:hypothetical protein